MYVTLAICDLCLLDGKGRKIATAGYYDEMGKEIHCCKSCLKIVSAAGNIPFAIGNESLPSPVPRIPQYKSSTAPVKHDR